MGDQDKKGFRPDLDQQHQQEEGEGEVEVTPMK